MSALPPAGHGTTMRTGFVGQPGALVWAFAASLDRPMTTPSNARAARPSRNLVRPHTPSDPSRSRIVAYATSVCIQPQDIQTLLTATNFVANIPHCLHAVKAQPGAPVAAR
jgi:hypothetical protein